MNIFSLPDLGEGLPDAEIHEWFVKEGDTVSLDQPLVAMETAKAVVDVPCPQDGVIVKLYGSKGDLIKTGQPLVGFEESTKVDKGTVVGNLVENQDLGQDNFKIGSQAQRIKVTPAVKLLAKKLSVDLTKITGSGDYGLITKEDVEKASQISAPKIEGFEPLQGVRRAMQITMAEAHKVVVPVSIFDEADIHSWSEKSDITVRLIQAIAYASKQEPALNTWFDTASNSRKCFESLNLGLAVDTDEGLFVPVIHEADKLTTEELRACINDYKKQLAARSIPAEKLKGATFTLSNFGKFAGRFASPIIVPPMVAILAVGRVYETLILSKDAKPESHKILPLSLSFDHRAVTGGEATRFLGAVIKSLTSS